MTQKHESDYAWGTSKAGLQAGLSLAPSQQGQGRKQLFGAIRNVGDERAQAPAIYELHIRTVDGESALAEGPRATAGPILEPGEMLEAFGWRITAEVCRPYSRCTVRLWCLLAPAAWLFSGDVEVDFGA